MNCSVFISTRVRSEVYALFQLGFGSFELKATYKANQNRMARTKTEDFFS